MIGDFIMDNIDQRMANYIAILSNPNLAQQFDTTTRLNMQAALVIYTKTTAMKYVQEQKSVFERATEEASNKLRAEDDLSKIL